MGVGDDVAYFCWNAEHRFMQPRHLRVHAILWPGYDQVLPDAADGQCLGSCLGLPFVFAPCQLRYFPHSEIFRHQIASSKFNARLQCWHRARDRSENPGPREITINSSGEKVGVEIQQTGGAAWSITTFGGGSPLNGPVVVDKIWVLGTTLLTSAGTQNIDLCNL